MSIGEESKIQNAMIEVLQDCVNANNKTIRRLQLIIILLIILLFSSFIYYVYSFNQYDYEDAVTTTMKAITDNNSNIHNSKNANAQNNININVPKK